jgi:hypothetical protein
LNTGNASRIVCYAHGPGGFPLEQFLFEMFREKKLKGEWFLLSKNDILQALAHLPVPDVLYSKTDKNNQTPIPSLSELLSRAPNNTDIDTRIDTDRKDNNTEEKNKPPTEDTKARQSSVSKMIEELDSDNDFGLASILYHCVSNQCPLNRCREQEFKMSLTGRNQQKQSRLMSHLQCMGDEVSDLWGDSDPLLKRRFLFVIKKARSTVGSEKQFPLVLKCLARNFNL